MKYFKVLRLHDGKLYSSWARGQASVDYEEGMLSKAPKWLADLGYGVTIFTSLRDAIAYRRTISGSNYSYKFPIFSVAIAGGLRTPGCMANNSGLSNGSFVPLKSSSWPEGTMMVDGIIPMRKVTDAEVKEATAK